MKNYSTLFWLVIMVLGAALYFMGNMNVGDKAESMLLPISTTETSTSTPTPTYVSTPTPTATPKEEEVSVDEIPSQWLAGETPPRSSITGPATCQLSGGTITFLDKNTAINDSAYIAYQNVDHPGRLLFWDINRSDGVLKMGPNIFDGLALPGGQQNVTVVIEGQPQFTSYLLTARINYGIVDKDGGVINTEETNCTGNIIINLDYLK